MEGQGVGIVQDESASLAFSLLDSSRVLTFVVSMSLIVYGSFTAVKLDPKGATKDDGEESQGGQPLSSFQSLHTIESFQAILLPIGASVTLLLMFFFFDSLQLAFTLLTAVLATVAFSFLLLPICHHLAAPCFNTHTRISFGFCGRFTTGEILALVCSSAIVLLWIVTGHWLLMDALAMALCVAMIAFVRLPSLKVSVLLLFGLLVYDVFWVFFSQYIFHVNVMMKVATQPAFNPVNIISDKFNFPSVRGRPMLSLPGKLVFPSNHRTGHFSMLGLGDIVMPGLLLCFVLRFDNHKRLTQTGTESPPRLLYFHFSLIGYFIGLVTATVASEVTKSAQPALLYLVPFTILPLVVRAYVKGDLRKMWQHPFADLKPSVLDV